MELLKLIKPEAVKVISTASSKKRLFHDIAEIAHVTHGLPESSTLSALLDRESLGPTGVGHGVALPHARIEGLSEVKGLFVLLEKPVEFNAVDHLPVDIVFALFAPEAAGVDHLKALALVSRTLRDKAFCDKLRANPDATTLYAILTEGRSEEAA